MWILDLICLSLIGVGCLAWTARTFSIATRDALDLAAKLSVPNPDSAIDWPELRVEVVVPDPDDPLRMLLVGRWPAHPDPRSLLVLEVRAQPCARHVLTGWRDRRASISPRSTGDGTVRLRRRHSVESIEARLVAEATLTGD